MKISLDGLRADKIPKKINLKINKLKDSNRKYLN